MEEAKYQELKLRLANIRKAATDTHGLPHKTRIDVNSADRVKKEDALSGGEYDEKYKKNQRKKKKN